MTAHETAHERALSRSRGQACYISPTTTVGVSGRITPNLAVSVVHALTGPERASGRETSQIGSSGTERATAHEPHTGAATRPHTVHGTWRTCVALPPCHARFRLYGAVSGSTRDMPATAETPLRTVTNRRHGGSRDLPVTLCKRQEP